MLGDASPVELELGAQESRDVWSLDSGAPGASTETPPQLEQPKPFLVTEAASVRRSLLRTVIGKLQCLCETTEDQIECKRTVLAVCTVG